MAAGDITWFRYAPHGGLEREVGPGEVPSPGHHSHYSYLEQIDPEPLPRPSSTRAEGEDERKFVLVRMELVGEPVVTPEGQSIVLARLASMTPGSPSLAIGLEDIAGDGAAKPSPGRVPPLRVPDR